jgi:hypothetical protein
VACPDRVVRRAAGARYDAARARGAALQAQLDALASAVKQRNPGLLVQFQQRWCGGAGAAGAIAIATAGEGPSAGGTSPPEATSGGRSVRFGGLSAPGAVGATLADSFGSAAAGGLVTATKGRSPGRSGATAAGQGIAAFYA